LEPTYFQCTVALAGITAAVWIERSDSDKPRRPVRVLMSIHLDQSRLLNRPDQGRRIMSNGVQIMSFYPLNANDIRHQHTG
jgi:hypothetical protein